MRIKKILSTGTLIAAGLLLLCACDEKKANNSNGLQIGMACYNRSDTYISSLIDSFKEQLGTYEKEGAAVTVTVMDAAGQQRTQNDQIKELILAGCKVLCVNLVDRTDPSEIIDFARENEVPIIFFNREPVAEDMQQWSELYYVGAYAKQSGIIQGNLAADAILADERIDRNHDDKIQYVVLEGEPGHQDSIIRTENAVNTLKERGVKLEKVSYASANWNRAQAQNRMTQLIGQYPNQIELVLGNNDDMVLGAMDAYESLNLTEASMPVFFGIDGTDVGLEAVADGRMAGTVYNNKEGQAEAMLKLALALFYDEGLEDIPLQDERYVYLDYAPVTAENVEEYRSS
ncbi:MAG: galactose ABC transporter substrate-binding protein [Marvinbryantia sp.]|jgi:methyl-galactoside transport system substrate-binding protein